MLDPFDYQNRHVAARLERVRLWTFLSLLLERLTAALWRVMAWAGFFCGLWLFQVQTFFGSEGSILAFAFFVAGILYFIWKDFVHFSWPKKNDIDRRIEQESKLRHRPLEALQDSLANPQKSKTRRLWEEAKIHFATLLLRIRPGIPRAFMAKHDPQAIRLGVLLFFAVGLYIAGPAWDERILQGLMPLHLKSAAENAERFSVWVTPPRYTALEAFLVKRIDAKNPVAIPSGSTLKIIVRNGTQPHLLIDRRGTDYKFRKMEDGSYILELATPDGTELTVKQGFFNKFSWNYKIIPDAPPKIEIKGAVEITHDRTMRFPIEVSDDYGVKNIFLNMTLNQSMAGTPLGEPVNDSRVVMSPPNTKLPLQPVYDLTSHPWAGQPVSITLSAEDGAGQKTSLEPILMTLPEREFLHPVAKKIIALRKQLILKPEDNYRPLSEEIENILIRPKLYLDDKVVFLALRAAASHLFWADPPSRNDAKDVVALLWDTALRAEGGEISIEARNMREAQHALEKALENPDISQQEIQKLMSDLRAAMTEYFMELGREMQKRMAEGQETPMIPPEMLARTIDPEALANFLEQMESRMMAGDKKSAQEMLGQLQRFLDMMDPSMAAPMPKDMQMMSDSINELQQLIDRQKDLLNQTKGQLGALETLKNTERGFGDILKENEKFPDDWHMDNMPPPPVQSHEAPPSIVMNTSPNRTEQESLRIMLGTLMQEAGEVLDTIPENMGQAEQEMRGSSTALGTNDPGGSIPHQEKTIEHLQQAQKQLAQQLMARLQQMTGLSIGSGMKFDPLGRPYGGNGNGLFGSPVKIPDEGERKKAQEILKMLRRRSSELGRPDEELDYYKRLLRQF